MSRISPFYENFLPFAVSADKIRLKTTTTKDQEVDLCLVAQLLSIEPEIECTDEVHEAELEEDLNGFFGPLLNC